MATPRERVESGIARTVAALPPAVQRRLAGRPLEIDGQRLETEVQLTLRLLQLSPRPDFATLPVADARREIEGEALVAAGRPLPVAEVRAIEAGGRPARLYVPPVDRGGLLVYLHGGGWTAGSLDSHDQTCRFLAREGQLRVLAVDYRLAPEAPFPAGLEDALAAWEWAVRNTPELGAESGRLAIGGDSAGGNLATVVARLTDAKPALQLLIYPVCDLSEKRHSYELFGEDFFLTEAHMDWYRGNYLADDAEANDPRVSPLLADDLDSLPPAYLAVAGFDPLRDEALEYAERLEAAGVRVTTALHEGLVHGFANAVRLGRTSPAAMRAAARALAAV